MKILDLYCGAGGGAQGYAQAGWDVVGVDWEPQPRFPFTFIQADALEFLSEHGREFDAIHASPPCQAHTVLKHAPGAKFHRDLIPETRRLLVAIGRPWVLENVMGAPLRSPIMLCGSMFNLEAAGAQLRRHRLFESSVFIPPLACRHDPSKPTIGVYGGHARNRKRDGRGEAGSLDFSQADAQEAMGIDWMTFTELSQAIPPAYTSYIGACLTEGMR